MFLPVPYPPENQPPEVVRSSFPTDGSDVIVLESELETLYALATDADEDDEVGYLWTIDGDVVSSAINLNPGSMITLEVDETLDGAELECTIYDGISDPVVLSALLEVP